jgi:hypothetical protein
MIACGFDMLASYVSRGVLTGLQDALDAFLDLLKGVTKLIDPKVYYALRAKVNELIGPFTHEDLLEAIKGLPP